MPIQEPAFQPCKNQVTDSFDDETGRLLSAFYSIRDPSLRQRLIGIIRDIPNDEAAADEILRLVSQALRVSDLSD